MLSRGEEGGAWSMVIIDSPFQKDTRISSHHAALKNFNHNIFVHGYCSRKGEACSLFMHVCMHVIGITCSRHPYQLLIIIHLSH